MALITAAEYKAFLEVGDTAQDTQIAALIPAVQARIENHCNRMFEDGATARTEYFDGRGDSGIVFPKYLPIVSVTTLHDDPLRSYGSDCLIAATDYVAYNRYVELDGGIFAKGRKNIKLVYVGGYVPTGAGENVPRDLKMAIAQAIAWNLQRMKKIAESSEAVANLNISKSYIVKLPDDIKEQLGPYRRHVI